LADYEQTKRGMEVSQEVTETALPSVESAPPPRSKSAPSKGGFTAVKASPLLVNPDVEAESGDGSEDEAAVAAELGGSLTASSIFPAKKQRREAPKHTDGETAKNEKREKAKDKEKEKEKDKRKRRKSGKGDS